jgi:MSHA pilin protein MshD
MLTAEQNFKLLQEIAANRLFLLQAYQQNPQLLERAESRISELFVIPSPGTETPHPKLLTTNRQRGISLIELIMFIVIIGIAVTGLLGVMNKVMGHSADPLIHKQALAAAESLLEEIELQDFIPVPGAIPTGVLNDNSNRSSEYHLVLNYNGFTTTTGIFPLNGTTPIAGLGNYNANVTVTNRALGAGAAQIPAASAVLITVAVTEPQGVIQVSGYRTAH